MVKKKEKEKLKYYFFVDKGKEWVNPVNGYFSYKGGVWNYMHQNRKKYQGKSKKLVIKNARNFVIERRDITHQDILDFKNNVEKVDKMENKSDKNYCYLFEIKIAKTLSSGILIVEWKSPLNSAFFNAFDAWGFIIRNREKYKNEDKRLRTVSSSSGEVVYTTLVDDELISNMEQDNFLGVTK